MAPLLLGSEIDLCDIERETCVSLLPFESYQTFIFGALEQGFGVLRLGAGLGVLVSESECDYDVPSLED